MPPRLNEQYKPGDLVEIVFEIGGDEAWHTGYIVMMQHPGVWVRLGNGSLWFVTNSKRIRPGDRDDKETEQ